MNKIAIGFGIGLPIGLAVGIKMRNQNVTEFLFPNQSFMNQFWKKSAKKFFDPMVYLPNEIMEMIFLELDCVDLVNCLSVSKSWNSYLINPRFWIKKCTRKTLSPEVQAKWKNLISLTERPQNEYLKEQFIPFWYGSIPFKMVKIKQNVSKLLMNMCLKNERSMITPFHAILKFRDIRLLTFCLRSDTNGKVLDIEQLDGMHINYVSKLIDEVINDLEKLNDWVRLISNKYKYIYKEYQNGKYVKIVTLCQTIDDLKSVRLMIFQKYHFQQGS